jgi:ribonuclease HI
MNNVLKFTSCFVGLHLIDALNAYPLQVQNDSQLVVGQCQRVYEVIESQPCNSIFRKFNSN